MKKNVVYIGAHPDDILSVAGTLLLLRNQGYAIYEFCLTRGEKGGRESNTGEIRSEEEREVCKILDAELRFFEEADGRLFAHEEICNKVAESLKEIEPVAVFTIWALEKPDHAATSNIAMKALNLANLTWTSELYMSQVGPGYNFRPDLHVNVSEVMDEVKKISECYKSQQTHGYPQNSLQRKLELGKNIWVDAAEGFMTTFPIVNQRWGRPSEVGRLLRTL